MIRLIFFFTFVSLTAFAQEENVFLTRKVKKGIYYTYQQFLTNSPPETEDFRCGPIPGTFSYMAGYVIKSQPELRPNQTAGDTTQLMYMLYDSRKKNKRIKNAYAFSDGEHIYINSAMYQSHGDYYLKVLDMGRLIYTRDPIMNQASGFGTGAIVGGAIGGVIGYLSANKESRGLIIFYEDEGVPFVLNKRTMTSILLNHDPELYELYKQEKDLQDEAVMEKYVLLFNQRHP